MGLSKSTARKQRGRPFPKGRSANPAGRPKGARNRATIIAEALLDGEAEVITRSAIESAKRGEPVALRLCMERILPPRRDRPINFDLGSIKCSSDASKVMSSLLSSVARGDVSPADAEAVGRLVETWLRSFEATELEGRLKLLEARDEASH